MSESAFSKLVSVNDLPTGGASFSLEANDAQCAAIADRLDTPIVRFLRASLSLEPSGNGVRLHGQLDARLERRCVASLEPVDEKISETIDVTFSRDADLNRDGDDFVFESGDIEPLESDEIDLGEFVIQQLALAMAPYPRKDDAASLTDEFGQTGDVSPFAVLKGLQSKPENKH
ncbi:MAG: DUF177 domain-containing protein [Pseudomonadota bacterium]